MIEKKWVLRVGIFCGMIEIILLASFQWKLAILYILGVALGMFNIYSMERTCEMVLYLPKKSAVSYMRKKFLKRYFVNGIGILLIGIFSHSIFEIVLFAIGILSIKFTIQLVLFLGFMKMYVKGKKSRFSKFYNGEFLGNKGEDHV